MMEGPTDANRIDSTVLGVYKPNCAPGYVLSALYTLFALIIIATTASEESSLFSLYRGEMRLRGLKRLAQGHMEHISDRASPTAFASSSVFYCL